MSSPRPCETLIDLVAELAAVAKEAGSVSDNPRVVVRVANRYGETHYAIRGVGRLDNGTLAISVTESA